MITLIRFALLWIGLFLAQPTFAIDHDSNGWVPIADGLEFGRFPAGKSGFGGDAIVTVLRADPAHWELDLLAASEQGGTNLTTEEWCDQFGLTAAINAGMFHPDYLTHVGFCSAQGHVNNEEVNQYQSVAAFCPQEEGGLPFRIFDLDDPVVTLDSIMLGYSCVVQNLRLIKRPGEGRWSQQPKCWSEAALGEDSQGRVLFIFCRTGYSMHDLNDILLSLPIDLVCAQHLEGGPEAQLFIQTEDFEAEFCGSYETGFFENDSNDFETRIPVALGLRAKSN